MFDLKGSSVYFYNFDFFAMFPETGLKQQWSCNTQPLINLEASRISKPKLWNVSSMLCDQPPKKKKKNHIILQGKR